MGNFLEWKYDEDTNGVMCRCPICGGRLLIGPYLYVNPYNYCPYCGEKLEEGEITATRKKVYGSDDEKEKRGRDAILRGRGQKIR